VLGGVEPESHQGQYCLSPEAALKLDGFRVIEKCDAYTDVSHFLA
jgi:hypothetical protein